MAAFVVKNIAKMFVRKVRSSCSALISSMLWRTCCSLCYDGYSPCIGRQSSRKTPPNRSALQPATHKAARNRAVQQRFVQRERVQLEVNQVDRVRDHEPRMGEPEPLAPRAVEHID